MLHCPYKAWKLLKVENNIDEHFIPNGNFSQRETLALVALGEMIRKNEEPAFYRSAHCPERPFLNPVSKN